MRKIHYADNKSLVEQITKIQPKKFPLSVRIIGPYDGTIKFLTQDQVNTYVMGLELLDK